MEVAVLNEEGRRNIFLKTNMGGVNSPPGKAVMEVDIKFNKREQEVIWLYLEGRKTKEIAIIFSVSYSRINHIKMKIKKKISINLEKKENNYGSRSIK